MGLFSIMEEQTKYLDDFVKILFGKPAQPKNSIQLTLDTIGDESETKEFVLFKQLMDIMCRAIPIVFKTDAKINLNEITAQQLKVLNEYFNSFGWEILLHRSNENSFKISMKNIVNKNVLPDCVYINI